MNELGSLLKMLDHETVSPATADKMASVRNIMDSMQLSGTEMKSQMEAAVYMVAYIPFLITGCHKPF